jgi:hypothetical protein
MLSFRVTQLHSMQVFSAAGCRLGRAVEISQRHRQFLLVEQFQQNLVSLQRPRQDRIARDRPGPGQPAPRRYPVG